MGETLRIPGISQPEDMRVRNLWLFHMVLKGEQDTGWVHSPCFRGEASGLCMVQSLMPVEGAAGRAGMRTQVLGTSRGHSVNNWG